MEKLLIIEDDQDVSRLLADILTQEGYQVTSLSNGMEGWKAIREMTCDLILLDLMLPYKSGDEILREIRSFSDIPVIIISAKDMVGTRVGLLRMGADDYITKPFDIDEVAARVETTLRRCRIQTRCENILTFEDLCLNTESKTVTVSGRPVSLTAKEYLILELLMKNQTKVFSKANLYESIWKEEYLGDDHTIKSHISNLRNKLKAANNGPEYIETVWGLGYRLFHRQK